jgi:hypothetical protein
MQAHMCRSYISREEAIGRHAHHSLQRTRKLFRVFNVYWHCFLRPRQAPTAKQTASSLFSTGINIILCVPRSANVVYILENNKG